MILTTYTPEELTAEAQERHRAETLADMRERLRAPLRYRSAPAQGVLFYQDENLFSGPAQERVKTYPPQEGGLCKGCTEYATEIDGDTGLCRHCWENGPPPYRDARGYVDGGE